MSPKFEDLGFNKSTLRKIEGDDVVDPTLDIPDGERVYGYRRKEYPRPELLSSLTEETGGFLFLPGRVNESLLEGLVEIAGMGSNERRTQNQFGIQEILAPEGMEHEVGYMRKLVIADRFALRYLYGSISEEEYDRYPEQPGDVADCVKAFVDSEREKYGVWFGSAGLAGKFGGDGNYAQEALGFGFAIENSYYHVISIWSRGWLCTK